MSFVTTQVLCSSVLLTLGWVFLRKRLFPTVLDNIPGPPADSWITGSLSRVSNRTREGWDFHKHIAQTYGGVLRLKGFFGANNLYVFDPKALHHILVKDQYTYEETDSFIEANKVIFGEGIFTSIGERHRQQRKMLNPVFSIAHMREMVPIFYEVTHKLRDTLVKQTQNGPKEVDIISWMTRLALELIGQSGLGFTFDTLAEGTEPHPYGIASKTFVPLSADSSPIARDIIVPAVTRIGSPRFRRWLVDTVPLKTLHQIRDVLDVLHKTSVEIFESKKKALREGDEALAAQIGRGKDIISILMKANMVASEEDKLSDGELLGQITSLTFAATDTTSGALSRTLHLLAMHPDVQKRLREEINNARQENGGEDIGYDILVSLPYLDAICRETLRLYPPVSTIIRTARQDIILPLATPIKGINGEEICEIPVPNGTDIHVSILSSNRNPQLWGPDAFEWKPERWLKPLPDSLVNAHVPGVYSHLMTFIGGGRSCIGFKFSQLEMKVVLALLLEVLEFSLSDKEIFWQMTGIVTPNIDDVSTTPTLPMYIRSV